MGKVRQGLYLQEWLEEQRQKRQRRKEREELRLQREKEEIEKQKAKEKAKEEKKHKKEREKQQRQQQREEEILQHSIYVQNRTIQIYRTNGRRSKFSSEDDLFNTWEEIKNAENDEKENGRINWERLPLLIQETRKLINGESKTKRR